MRASASGDPGGVPAAREIQAAGRRLGRSRRGRPARARARPTEGRGGRRRAKRTDFQAGAGGGRPSRRPTVAAARRAACGCVLGSVSEGSNRPLGLYRYPHGLTLTLTVYCARHSAQRRHRTPNRRHGDATALWRTPYTPEPWREPEKRHGDMATIWRRYSDALTTMGIYTANSHKMFF